MNGVKYLSSRPFQLTNQRTQTRLIRSAKESSPVFLIITQLFFSLVLKFYSKVSTTLRKTLCDKESSKNLRHLWFLSWLVRPRFSMSLWETLASFSRSNHKSSKTISRCSIASSTIQCTWNLRKLKFSSRSLIRVTLSRSCSNLRGTHKTSIWDLLDLPSRLSDRSCLRSRAVSGKLRL